MKAGWQPIRRDRVGIPGVDALRGFASRLGEGGDGEEGQTAQEQTPPAKQETPRLSRDERRFLLELARKSVGAAAGDSETRPRAATASTR